MRRTVVLAVLLILSAAGSLPAEDIYFDYTVKADKDLYRVGEEVRWEISAYIVGPTRGIKALDVSLYESRNEVMTPPLSGQVPAWEYHFMVDQFKPLDYDTTHKMTNYFHYKNYFEVSGTGIGTTGAVAGLGVSQFVERTDQNFANALDKTGGILCEGKYPLTKTGWHDLYLGNHSGTVWKDAYGNIAHIARAGAFGEGFYVTSSPAADLGTVSLSLLSVMQAQMGTTDANEANGWSQGADLTRDGRVDGEDLQVLFDQGGAQIDVAADLYAAGDLTQDDRLDLRDYAAFAAHWRTPGATRSNLWHHGSDFDRTGTVDPNDLLHFARLWPDHLKHPRDPNSVVEED